MSVDNVNLSIVTKEEAEEEDAENDLGWIIRFNFDPVSLQNLFTFTSKVIIFAHRVISGVRPNIDIKRTHG